MAGSISRTLSENYLDLTLGIRTENIQILLAPLSEHIMAELKRALESRFPMPAINLRRNSVDEIQSAIDNLMRHGDKKVSANARKIVIAALNRANLTFITEILRTEYGH